MGGVRVGPELEEAALGVTRTDLDQLKQTAPSVISEILLKKVLDINQVSAVCSLLQGIHSCNFSSLTVSARHVLQSLVNTVSCLDPL